MTDSTSDTQSDSGEPHSLTEVLDTFADAGEGDQVRVDDMLGSVADRSLGVLLALFGLVALIPVIGSIPGASIALGTLVLLAIANSLLGRGALRVPGFIGRREVQRDKLEAGVERARPWVRKVDAVLSQRLELLAVSRPARVVIALCAAALAVAMYPLAVVPFGVTAPAAGLLAFGLALMARDGFFALAGYALAAVTLWMGLTLV
ncbi:exopolysaccharide biosynthesis protein [Oceanicella sp. SM1341]|uniref:exopolysaccharide biosynthesis protein n=1 Tax=Oceanicella sp. SM1341 TaxID=1548889 RepID=UPI000E536515|nr:exopolysaccharide biosynthesis protein [Oceanicella sp. SM1341]